MSWDKVEGKYTPRDACVRLSVIRPSGFNKQLRLKVILGRAVLSSLGWNIGCRVNMYIGSGKDRGRIRLELHHLGRYKLISQGRGTHGAAFFSTNILPPDMPPRARPVCITKHTAIDGSIEIEVPKGFYSTDREVPPSTTTTPSAISSTTTSTIIPNTQAPSKAKKNGAFFTVER